MAVYPTNQNRHFYVASKYAATVTQASDEGTIGGVKCIDNGAEKEIYFLYKGADTVLRSDIIQVKNINYIKAIPASKMIRPLKEIELTLDPKVNKGQPIAGQDYVLRINFRQFFGMSDEDQYFKDVAVHATKNMTDTQFFTALKNALDLSFSREVGANKTSNPYLTFTVTEAVEEDTDNDVEAAPAKLTIMEKEQDWYRGTKKFEKVLFDVFPTTVYDGGDDVIWGKVEDVTAANTTVGTDAIGNGKEIADMEWFFLGERGDQYRLKGWPNYIPTKYMVDPSLEYHVLEINYAFTDTGVNSYRSEKDITIVIPTSKKSDLDIFIGAIKTATGFSIATLS
jgi:hypothetical protein